jgi:hypothetical protein
MQGKKEVHPHPMNGGRRRSARYRVEAPVEISWFEREIESKADGWVLELDREYAYITSRANLAVATEVHVFVVLPPFGELNRIMKIGFDATVEWVESRVEPQDETGLMLKIHKLVLTGDEGQEEFSQRADSSEVS